ncbi:MAG: DUF4928 domain-containing protein [Sphingobacteriales bacterium]|nr:MAG: DUF4928 domain-containing protein [Sphingobacteriales bacterium]
MKDKLDDFREQYKVNSRGYLCVALFITDGAKALAFPLIYQNFLTPNKGQVSGLNKSKIQEILARNGIAKVLSEEAGRTSRGTVGFMQVYVTFLNGLKIDYANLNLEYIENYWIECVKKILEREPFALRLDPANGLRVVIRDLMSQAEQRQKEYLGFMFLGTMMQHLVGAKLSLVLDPQEVDHHCASTNDSGHGRFGDFAIGDVAIHVTSAPSEALISKCKKNIEAGKRPLIVTTMKGTYIADGIAENAGIADRIDIIEFEQFLASNIYEMGKFTTEHQIRKIEDLINFYNKIIEEYETDHSLKILVQTKSTKKAKA